MYRQYQQINFVPLNRFCPISKKTHSLFLKKQYQAGWNTNQNEMKNTNFWHCTSSFKVLFIKINEIEPPAFCLLLFYISSYIGRCHWAIPEKNKQGGLEQWPSGWGTGFPIQASHVRNHWEAPRLTQPFILLRSIKLVPGISGNLVVKSKLPSWSDSSYEVVKPHL